MRGSTVIKIGCPQKNKLIKDTKQLTVLSHCLPGGLSPQILSHFK